ncbi:hypothetical protein CLAFUW4_04749 [Fulvia fulva]|uniref:Uncharacterized protein n=1 Tax=Passalora fulva TaxID=5499 RepID=A0A9Q8PI07_PASFU|nr:uncharacterized protein CLAFUR5_12151 [Fulvia fulva]KAK4627188.1 hypothetical protein CLAFUR4_04735 [Fulvia fulva]KAK4628072.1 hypothetical protein CLAFUR0_04739 [Fulvia fulva]UJO22818.1 hypothetical protein CLAFUR5_12151 [Fulvia fulva]WPV13903.1 hypothetical protein CLAFUW4_04749 [Fulvia fulva]WPV29355.1 hypothetical protein CLAFUW7_04743 [Fulvia fulva]
MKFSIVALPALFLGAWAAPTAMQSKRQQLDGVTSLVSGLLDNVLSSTGTINKTIDGVSGVNVDKEVKAAIKLNIKTIVNDVEDVVPQIAELKIADSLLKEVENFVSGLVSQVVEEVSTTLKIVEDMIPVDDITDEVSDLTGSLSGLLSGLEKLGLTNILSTVTGLLSGTGALSTVTGLLSGLPLGL